MKNLRTEEEIIANWEGDIEEPLVSISCITYNHEAFIADALEGFLIQETNFPFEILIHDDASTDKTADIIREYQVKYPRLIKPIYQTENQYSKRIKVSPTFNYPRAKGRYIAVCEGDDYWVDCRKIQIQSDYLESNSDIVITGHDAIIIDENNKTINYSKLPNSHKKDFIGDDLVKNQASILTLSWMFRNVITSKAPEGDMVLNGDNFMISLLGHYGGSHYHHDIKSAVYRIHRGGVWSAISEKEQIDAQSNTFFWLYRYYQRIDLNSYADYYWHRYTESLFIRLSYLDIFKKVLIKMLRHTKKFCKKIINRVKFM